MRLFNTRIPEDAWPPLLESVGIDTMRERARGDGDRASLIFEGGAGRFFYQGSNGRWRDVLTDDDLALYDAAAATVEPFLRAWLEGGRHVIGMD